MVSAGELAAVQKMNDPDEITLITQTARLADETHGFRAKCLQRLIRIGMPVPTTVALSFETIRALQREEQIAIAQVLCHFDDHPILSVRPSSQSTEWGGPSTVLNIGMCDETYQRLEREIGELAALPYMRLIQTYATEVSRLDPEPFATPEMPYREGLAAMLATYEEEAEEPFPQSLEEQLHAVLSSMACAWNSTSARLLRNARGAPSDAALGLVVQNMILGFGPGECGSGVISFVDRASGHPRLTGRYLRESQGREAVTGCAEGALYLGHDARGASLEDQCPDILQQLIGLGKTARQNLKEEMEIEFGVQSGVLSVLDAVRVHREPRAAVRIAVDLANDGVISASDAVLRVDPNEFSQLLHRRMAPDARREVLARGVAASPGAAAGRVVFSAEAAQAAEAREEPAILFRRETGPEDIRGMHSAAAVVTERGGTTSHAAVIGRGIGLPCVVGVSLIKIDARKRQVMLPSGDILHEGDILTVDGSAGELLAGTPEIEEAGLDDAVQTLLGWAAQRCDIGIRANADTPQDARTALNFACDGIGLCRTEHMFFEAKRLSIMHEMIFADDPVKRAAVLARLLPIQRSDFQELFRLMEKRPVCIRLLDPPLHEFLPSDTAGMRQVAAALGKTLSDVDARVQSMREYNPMLGLRGVRLGITFPEIYEMQARAIFEAACLASHQVEPEIMIPLVTAYREVELIRARIDAVAAAVRSEQNVEFTYQIGVMVETPRAALRAGDIAHHASFLSFGTNDLTQMTYGLSRDDAGRFMSSYVNQDVFAEDPFRSLDLDGVGELLREGAKRGRATRPDLMLSLCGEHGGDPSAIEFCRQAKYSYVSCSPYRVPVARLAAAQSALRESKGD